MNARLYEQLQVKLAMVTMLLEHMPRDLTSLPLSDIYRLSSSYRRIRSDTDQIAEILVAAMHQVDDAANIRWLEDASLLAEQAKALTSEHSITHEDDEHTASKNEIAIAKIGSLLRAIARLAADASPTDHSAV